MTEEGDAMNLFTSNLFGPDLQQAICILKFVAPFTVYLQRGQANESKEKSIIKVKKNSIIYMKIYFDYSYFRNIIK